MKLKSLLFSCLLFFAAVIPAIAQGTINIALAQSVDSNGRPLVGCLLYIYQAGTVATPQNAFTDTGLTLPLPNPMSCDANGRLPMFYLASGSVHVRLTDASGIVQFDYPSMLVVGPAGGGGGGGVSVDPTTIAATGDFKFRPTSELLAGWVKANGQTIGSATSGASGRANNDTQALFIYVWNNCTNAHCPVPGGRGVSGLADFGANKQITLFDFRARSPVGLDDMGNIPAGILLPSNVTSGGGDGVTTPGATGGESNHLLLLAELVAHTHTATVTDPGHNHALTVFNAGSVGANAAGTASGIVAGGPSTNAALTGITVGNSSTGGGGTHNIMDPFMLGTWHIKL
jgi:hypothetical protein